MPAAASAARPGARGDLSSGGAEARWGEKEAAAGGRKRGPARAGALGPRVGEWVSVPASPLHAAFVPERGEKFPQGDGGENPGAVWRFPPWISGQRPLWGNPFRKPPPH